MRTRRRNITIIRLTDAEADHAAEQLDALTSRLLHQQLGSHGVVVLTAEKIR
jgi:hypothetical protein